MAYCKVEEARTALSDRIKKLMDWNGVGFIELSEAIDICALSLRNIISGKSGTDYTTVCRIADYFAVSVDWLLGRVDELDEIMAKEYFNAARILSYETYLRHEKNTYAIPEGYRAPWPYNLVEDILGPNVIDGPMSNDQAAGLDHILNTISERTREMILMRYRDGMTLEEIGKEYHLQKARIGQIVAKGVMCLRHPSRTKYVLNGYSGEKTRQKCADKQREYEDLCRKLDDMIAEKRYLLDFETKEIERLSHLDYVHNAYGHSISELDLSVRAYNCLLRAKCDTVGDIVGLIAKNSEEAGGGRPEDILFYALLKICNMGRHSAQEVVDKLKALGVLNEAA